MKCSCGAQDDQPCRKGCPEVLLSQQAMTRIHVRRDVIARDRKTGAVSPAIGVETTGMRKRYGTRITIHGPATVVYRPERPLKCGARAWMETTSPVTVHR